MQPQLCDTGIVRQLEAAVRHSVLATCGPDCRIPLKCQSQAVHDPRSQFPDITVTNARPSCFEPGRLQERDDSVIEDGIVIQNGVAIGSRLGKRRSELLHDPLCRRMPCNVEVQDLAALVLDDEETV